MWPILSQTVGCTDFVQPTNLASGFQFASDWNLLTRAKKWLLFRMVKSVSTSSIQILALSGSIISRMPQVLWNNLTMFIFTELRINDSSDELDELPHGKISQFYLWSKTVQDEEMVMITNSCSYAVKSNRYRRGTDVWDGRTYLFFVNSKNFSYFHSLNH